MSGLTGGAAKVMNGPRSHADKLSIELCLPLGHALHVAAATTGKNIRVGLETRLLIDDLERDVRQHQRSSGTLLTVCGGNNPLVLIQIIPLHRQHLLSTLCGE